MTRLGLLLFAAMAGACGGRSTASPTPVADSTLMFTGVTPASGTTLIVPAQYPYFELGGVVLPHGSGVVSVGLSIRSARAVPWAQLRVYLQAGETQFCGQNLPDAPTWTDLPAGWETTYTVTGFQLYRLPCEVTAVRAMLHTRNTGLLLPPPPSEIVAEATLPVSIMLRR